MSSRSISFAHQCIAASGIAIMDHRVAWQLRPDLWASAQDCAMTFRAGQKIEGIKRMTATFPGFGPVLVLARSLDNLDKRLEWIVGLPVVDLKPAAAEAAPAIRVDPMRQAANAKEAERLDRVRKLAIQELPSHDCQARRDIMAAKAELGLPIAA